MPIVHGAERVLELIEDAGAVVVAMENCTGLKPILDDVDLDEPDPASRHRPEILSPPLFGYDAEHPAF